MAQGLNRCQKTIEATRWGGLSTCSAASDGGDRVGLDEAVRPGSATLAVCVAGLISMFLARNCCYTVGEHRTTEQRLTPGVSPGAGAGFLETNVERRLLWLTHLLPTESIINA